MEITCYEVVPGRVELRPAPRRRDWMDETANAFAYRCLPLTVANTHGWEMLCPFAFEARWNGGRGLQDLELDVPDAARSPALETFVASHFGTGILTFNPLLVFRTPPGYNLWVSGPANSFKDGIQAMSAVIETDWMPYTFSVNWKLTRPGTVRFAKDEPFCAVFPIARGTIASCEPRLAAITEDPALETAYRWALARRELDTTMAGSTKEQFQGWYTRGEMPDRSRRVVDDHELTVAAKPFRIRDDD